MVEWLVNNKKNVYSGTMHMYKDQKIIWIGHLVGGKRKKKIRNMVERGRTKVRKMVECGRKRLKRWWKEKNNGKKYGGKRKNNGKKDGGMCKKKVRKMVERERKG